MHAYVHIHTSPTSKPMQTYTCSSPCTALICKLEPSDNIAIYQ